MATVSGIARDASGDAIAGRLIRAYRRDNGVFLGDAVSGTGVADGAYADTSLLLPGRGLPGSKSIVDRSASPKTITVIGDVHYSVEQALYGGTSMKFDGAGDMLRLDYNSAFHLPGDFTIEILVYFNSLASAHLINYAGGNGVAWASWEVVFDGTYLRFAGSSANSGYDIGGESGSVSIIGTPTTGKIHRVLVTRSGNNWRGRLDGVLGMDFTSSLAPYSQTDRGITIGGFYNGYPWGGGPLGAHLDGFIAGLRVVKGQALDTSDPELLAPWATSSSAGTLGAYSIDTGSYTGKVQLIRPRDVEDLDLHDDQIEVAEAV